MRSYDLVSTGILVPPRIVLGWLVVFSHLCVSVLRNRNSITSLRRGSILS